MLSIRLKYFSVILFMLFSLSLAKTLIDEFSDFSVYGNSASNKLKIKFAPGWYFVDDTVFSRDAIKIEYFDKTKYFIEFSIERITTAPQSAAQTEMIEGRVNGARDSTILANAALTTFQGMTAYECFYYYPNTSGYYPSYWVIKRLWFFSYNGYTYILEMVSDYNDWITNISFYNIIKDFIEFNADIGLTKKKAENPNIMNLHCYPNPFNPTINITFEINKKDFVTIGIYDIQGKLLKQLTQKEYMPGFYKYILNTDENILNSTSALIVRMNSAKTNKLLTQKVYFIK